jgi:hypothetical protein
MTEQGSDAVETGLRDERQMRCYLLGALDAVEMISMDARCLAEQEYRLAFWEAEAHLIEDYVRNRLSAVDRAAFQRHYMSTLRNQENVSLIVGLISKQKPRTFISPLFRGHGTWLAAAALITLFFVGWFSVSREVGKQTAQPGGAANQQNAGALASKLVDEEAKLRAFEQNRLAIFSVGQIARGVSGGGLAPLVIPSGASEVTLVVPRDIELPDPKKATLYTEGSTNRTAIDTPRIYVPPHSAFALAYVKSQILLPGSYQIELNGQRSFAFRISQK